VSESSNAYFGVDGLLRQLANPNLHGMRSDRDARRGSDHPTSDAALDAAIANYPDQRFTLRNGILVIREHAP
jgi:hypothetical protein